MKCKIPLEQERITSLKLKKNAGRGGEAGPEGGPRQTPPEGRKPACDSEEKAGQAPGEKEGKRPPETGAIRNGAGQRQRGLH
ncbi:hypothetical protein NDU88_001815 [Pleurodeles waltl]|uniref:Uncharacterized protein n=1 Tax=Pleurodeles waltl TaxID=8319 RepID=A0AAV7VAR2_PLEWA|nr:hypothetical protein NDU88_001815 [Pleurodeles waltl]